MMTTHHRACLGSVSWVRVLGPWFLLDFAEVTGHLP